MALRLIEIILPENRLKTIGEILKDKPVIEQRQMRFGDDQLLIRILLDSDKSEEILDLLSSQFASDAEHLVILPVQAVVPVVEKKEEKSKERIAREELYEDIKSSANISRVYLIMVVLSAIVAAIGLQRTNIPMIIGAMVIAPLLGPNMALALGTTLGDIKLLRRAIKTALVGYAVAIGFSALSGFIIDWHEGVDQLMFRSRVGIGDLIVALASGCAGALAFTSGVSAILIGVMLAVSLLPPLVTVGILLGSGNLENVLSAGSLFLMNLICINLAAVVTFVVQGLSPASWWEKDRASRASRWAIALWVLLLAILTTLIFVWKPD